MSASKWNGYNNNEDKYADFNANVSAVRKNDKSRLREVSRNACYDKCIYPIISEERYLSEKSKKQMKEWMKCYDNCLKKNPYTTLERRLHRIATRTNKSARRNNITRRRKNE